MITVTIEFGRPRLRVGPFRCHHVNMKIGYELVLPSELAILSKETRPPTRRKRPTSEGSHSGDRLLPICLSWSAKTRNQWPGSKLGSRTAALSKALFPRTDRAGADIQPF